MSMKDKLVEYILKVFVVILVICATPTLIMFAFLGVIFFGVEYIIKQIMKMFDDKITIYYDDNI